MATLSMELIKQEYDNWKKSIKNSQNKEILDFGKSMSNKFNLNDKVLEEELDHNVALLHLMSKHFEK